MRTRVITITLAAAIAVAACGSTEAEPTAAPEPTPMAAASATPNPTADPTPEASTEAADATPEPSPTANPEPTVSPDSVLPSVEVVDVRSGATVDVASLVPSTTPVLLWAWAPHCPACRAEAPSAEAFAAAHVDEITMVGLGTQDDFAYAEGFLRDTGVSTPQMLWDASFESWARLGISAQPTWILVDGSGELVGSWVGRLPEGEVLAAARAA